MIEQNQIKIKYLQDHEEKTKNGSYLHRKGEIETITLTQAQDLLNKNIKIKEVIDDKISLTEEETKQNQKRIDNEDLGDDLEEEEEEEEITPQEAKYQSDKATIETPHFKSHIQKNYQEEYPKTLNQDTLTISNITQESWERYRQENHNLNALFQEQENLRNELIPKLRSRDQTLRLKAIHDLAHHIINKNHIYTTREDQNPIIYFYQEGIYKPIGKAIIKEIIEEILKDTSTAQIRNEIIQKIEINTYIDPQELYKETNLNEIPLQNGILNLKTRKLTPHTPTKIFFNKLPLTYDSKAKCPAITKHLEEVLSTPNERKIIEELAGLILLRDYMIEKAIMFLGDGRNGKGKTIELLKRFVGKENTSSVPLQNMRPDSFYLIQMHKKLLNISGDLDQTTLRETGTFKGVIGRDQIGADVKNKNAINFENYATVVFASNELPKVYDNTLGFWSKWVLLEFPYTFKTQEEYNKIPTDQRTNIKIIDPTHINKITSQQELNGFLNLALNGLERINKQNDYTPTKSTEEIKNLWIMKTNSFQYYCKNYLTEDYDGFIIKKDLRNAYQKFIRKNKLIPESDKTIKETLQTTYGVTESYKTTFNNQQFVWEGIKFKENP